MDEDPGCQELESGELLPVAADLKLHREKILTDPPLKPLSLTGLAADSQAQEHD